MLQNKTLREMLVDQGIQDETLLNTIMSETLSELHNNEQVQEDKTLSCSEEQLAKIVVKNIPIDELIRISKERKQ
jgi:hypothetical protein